MELDGSLNPSCKISGDLVFTKLYLLVCATEFWRLKGVGLGDGTKLVLGPASQSKYNSAARITDSHLKILRVDAARGSFLGSSECTGLTETEKQLVFICKCQYSIIT